MTLTIKTETGKGNICMYFWSKMGKICNFFQMFSFSENFCVCQWTMNIDLRDSPTSVHGRGQQTLRALLSISTKTILGYRLDWNICLTKMNDKTRIYSNCLKYSQCASFTYIVFSECDGGRYGHNCSNTCGFCLNKEQCHVINGSCLNGCDSDYWGDQCTQCKKNVHLRSIF